MIVFIETLIIRWNTNTRVQYDRSVSLFAHCQAFVGPGIHRSPVDSSRKGLVMRSFGKFFSCCCCLFLTLAWRSCWINNRVSGDLRRQLWFHHTHILGGRNSIPLFHFIWMSDLLIERQISLLNFPRCVWALQWCHNGRDGVSNPHVCLLNRLFRCRSKKTSKHQRHWPLCGEFTGNAENVSICLHDDVIMG